MFGRSIKRKAGESLSTSVRVRSGRRGANLAGSKKPKRSLNLTAAQKAEEAAFFRGEYGSLSQAQRNLLEPDDNAPLPTDFDWIPIPAAGDEGDMTSGAGGEQELCDEILEKLRFSAKRRDPRTRHDRTHLRNMAWDEQMDELVLAYLHWLDAKEEQEEGDMIKQRCRSEDQVAENAQNEHREHGGVYSAGRPTRQPHAQDEHATANATQDEQQDYIAEGWPDHTAEERQVRVTEPEAPTASLPARDELQQLHVYAVDFFQISVRTFQVEPGDVHPNVVLLRQGYLGTAPRNPSTVVALHVLEAYRQLHRVCPKLSIYAQVKALCHLQKVPFRRPLVEEFSIAFDAYIEILHRVQCRVDNALQRTGPEWRLKNICPPCMYKLANEPELPLSLLCAMDGNSSLKLVDSAYRAGTARADGRIARADFWITPEQVDKYKAEQSTAKAATVDSEPDHEAGNVGDLPLNADCVERWRAAQPDERKKMFALFSVSGIFACFCRHGHLLLACDMIRTGEQRKYPLAVIERLLEAHGKDIGLAYDVGCDLQTTLMNSSLGGKAREQQLRLIVPAFHGHAHNRLCQLSWHPMYINGCGKEDFEGCERAYGDSNQLASGTRLASVFHRAQAIEMHFNFRSDDKYAESGTFLYNNYRQSLQIIADDSPALALLSAQLGTTAEDYEQSIISEREYLRALKQEPAALSVQFEYVDALQNLDQARVQFSTASAAYHRLDYDIRQGKLRGGAITAVKNRYYNAVKRLDRLEDHVVRLEESMDIEDRWTPDSDAYKAALHEQTLRKYRLALDNLERLVVQRLLELNKLGMAGLGYKLREKIGKALRTRAEAIRKALDEYNKQAVRLDPPRPTLPWTELINMTTLGEFDLLRNARQDVRELRWAHPTFREAARLYFNIKRAHEEVRRCNVEIKRLLTHMFDEHVDYYHAASVRILTDPLLARELHRRWLERNRVNAKIAERLLKISRLPGFSGSLQSGTREGRDPTLSQSAPLPSWATASAITPAGNNDEEDESGEASQLANAEQAGDFLEFVDRED